MIPGSCAVTGNHSRPPSRPCRNCKDLLVHSATMEEESTVNSVEQPLVQPPRATYGSGEPPADPQRLPEVFKLNGNRTQISVYYSERAQDVFRRFDNNHRVLMSLLLGSKHPSLTNPFNKPFLSSDEATKTAHPTKSELAREVFRRSHFLVKKKTLTPTSIPKPKGWKLEKMIEWLSLEKNYINSSADEEFLKVAFQSLQNIFQQMVEDNQRDTNTDKWLLTSARSLTVRCRVITVVTSDEFRDDYLERKTAKTRREIDSRNSASAPPTIWQKMADKFNNSDYKPSSLPLPTNDYGPWFEKSHVLGKPGTLADFTAHDIEQEHNRLIRKVRVVKNNWEASGQGDGSAVRRQLPSNPSNDSGSDSDSHHDSNPELLDGTAKASFLGTAKAGPEVLYAWYAFDIAEMLNSAMTQIPPEICAGDGTVPSVYSKTVDEDCSLGSLSVVSSKKRDTSNGASDVDAIVSQMSRGADQMTSRLTAAMDRQIESDARLADTQSKRETLTSLIKDLNARIAAKKKDIRDQKKQERSAKISVRKAVNNDDRQDCEEELNEIRSMIAEDIAELAILERTLAKNENCLDRIMADETPRRSGSSVKKRPRVDLSSLHASNERVVSLLNEADSDSQSETEPFGV